MVNDIKEKRVQIDACIRAVRGLATQLGEGAGRREVSLSITKLQEAKMWLGQALGELGTHLPPEYRDWSEPADVSGM